MKFVALDVETANPDVSSICQIGVVHFEDGNIVDSWSTFIDPKDYFHDMNVSIHGISERDVRGAPDFRQVSTEIQRRISDNVVAIHTAFDRSSITKASLRNEVNVPDCIWLNTASVARRAWPDIAQKGYGLSSLSKRFGIEFEHHNAVEDARAAGLILVRAMAETNLDLDGWIDRVKRPIIGGGSYSVARDGNPDGPLLGEVVVFTGSLSIPRRKASDLAAMAGCETADGVNKQTTILVVGDQDIRLLNGQEKSNKHRKAEELVAKGIPIRIITESDFISMVEI